MAHEHHATAIAACYACADLCDHCAIACLNEPDPKPLARCIALDIDCAQTCRLTAGFLARRSANDAVAAAFCVEICEACATECAKHKMDHCQACANACRKCADECRRMAAKPPAAAGTHARSG